MRLRHSHRRAGFTLVELLVAAGLTLLIMAILSTAFQVGLDSLRLLKATGDMADRLRTAETLLRQDLDAPHFDTGVSPAGSPQLGTSSNPGSLLLSQLRLDTDPSIRPAGGFFQIRQPVHPVGFITLEGADQDQLSSTRALTHGISFTMRRTGKTPGDLFAAVDGGMGPILAQQGNQTDVAPLASLGATLNTEWAEVHWFLDLSRPTNVNGVDTFPLCRRVRLLTTTSVPGVAPLGSSLAEVVSADPAGNTNTLATIANPANRLESGVTPRSLFNSTFRPGDDIVITNVLSFEVKPTWEVVSGGTPSPRPSLGVTAAIPFNADFPFDDLPPAVNAHVFDTAVVTNEPTPRLLGGFAPAIPAVPTQIFPARVTGVQIKIRVYNGKNKLTRQSVVTSKL